MADVIPDIRVSSSSRRSELSRNALTGMASSNMRSSSSSPKSRHRGGTGVSRRLLRLDSKQSQPLPNSSGRYDHRSREPVARLTSKTVHCAALRPSEFSSAHALRPRTPPLQRGRRDFRSRRRASASAPAATYQADWMPTHAKRTSPHGGWPRNGIVNRRHRWAPEVGRVAQERDRRLGSPVTNRIARG